MPTEIPVRSKKLERLIASLDKVKINNVKFLADIIRAEKESKSPVITVIGDVEYKMAEDVADNIDRYRLKSSQKQKILEDWTLVMFYVEFLKLAARDGAYKKVPAFTYMEP